MNPNGERIPEQIKLIMECCQSGLSDYQWCQKQSNYELKKIGNNINQIAHKANSNDSATAADIKKLQEEWKSVMKIISMKFLRFT